MRKLGVDSRTAATYYAIQNGLVDTVAVQIEHVPQSEVPQKKSLGKFSIWTAVILIPLILLVILMYELRTAMPARPGVRPEWYSLSNDARWFAALEGKYTAARAAQRFCYQRI